MPYAYDAGSADWWGASHIEKIYLFEVDAYNLTLPGDGSGAFASQAFAGGAFGDGVAQAAGVGALRLRFSTNGYSTSSTDTPASTYYEPRVAAVRLDWRLNSSRWSGLIRMFGEADLLNGDGGLDQTFQDYSFNGREFRILAGQASFTRDEADAVSAPNTEFVTLFRGTVESVSLNSNVMRFRLSQGLDQLEIDLKRPHYAGTGGMEGGPELADKPKPTVYGWASNVTPVLVDPTNLIYDVGKCRDLSLQYIPSARRALDRGVPLTKVAPPPGSGQFTSLAGTGELTLGATPAGTLTADVSDNYLFAHSALPPATLLDRLCDAQDIAMNASALSTLESLDPYGSGLYIGTEPARFDQLIEAVLHGQHWIGWFHETTLEFHADRLNLPGTPGSAADLDDASIAACEVIELPSDVNPRIYKVTVNYQKNYTVQTDIASGSPVGTREILSSPAFTIMRSDDGLKSRQPAAREFTIDSLLSNETVPTAGALALCDRVLALLSAQRKQFRLACSMRGAKFNAPQQITIQHSRFGLSSLTAAYVIGYNFDSTRGTVELEVVT